MKFNKFRLLVSGHIHGFSRVKMREEKICENIKQKLLGLELGRNLNFDDYKVFVM